MDNSPVKKIIEIEAIKRFIINEQIVFNKSKLNVNPEEPSDIDYEGIGYQIVTADFEFQKSMGITPKDTHGVKVIPGRVRNPDDIWNDFVIGPLRKKSKYGKSAQGIKLLINSPIEPPWIEERIKIMKTLDTNMREIGKLFFDEIYIVFPERNLKIYP